MDVQPNSNEILSQLRTEAKLAELVLCHLIDIEALYELEACLDELVSRLIDHTDLN